MTTEDRLRRALQAEAERVTPADQWDAVSTAAHEASRRRRTRQRTWLTVATSAAVVALVVGAFAVFAGDDDAQELDAGPAATTAQPQPEPTETSEGERPTATTVIPSPPDDAIWPHTATAFDDPVDVAESFMRDYLGMTDPAGRQVDARPGMTAVEVRRAGRTGRASTTVLVVQRSRHFWVIRADSPQIRLDQPQAMATIGSPVHVEGAASAFEGNVLVEVRQATTVLGAAPVTGSGSEELGPFAGEIEFREPGGGPGALVLSVSSAEDGGLDEATVVPVTFATEGASAPDCTPPVGDGGRAVRVALTCGEQLVFVTRPIGDTLGVLRAALEALLAGATAEERDAGLTSMFSDATAGLLRDVDVTEDGTAIVVLDSALPEVIPNASTSTGSTLFLGQLNETVFQFQNVHAIEYRLDGSCGAFWAWLQGSCHVVERTD